MNKLKEMLIGFEYMVWFIIILIATVVIAKILGAYLSKILLKKSTEQNSNVTGFVFIKHVVIIFIYLLGLGWALYTLPISKNFSNSLFAGAGISTLAIGFASQQLLGNMMSGVLLIMKKQFKIGDVIDVQGNRGRVLELTLHDTIIEDEEKNIIIIPNSMISNGVIKNIKK